ncbi:MAG TPA: CdaR family protein [Abditibacteriaceae bacterium]|jgi:YbbR domain-containing protein
MQRITNNWSLKLISVVLAVLLWSHVRGEVNPLETTTLDVPLRAAVPRDMVLLNATDLPEKVTVILRGPRQALRDIKGGSLANPLEPTEHAPNVVQGAVKAGLDFSRIKAGAGGAEQEIPVVASSGVEDVEVLSVKPSAVAALLDRAERDTFTVRPQWNSLRGRGWNARNLVASPARIEAFGPSNTLAEVASIRADAAKRVATGALKAGRVRIERVPLVALNRAGDVVSGVRLNPDSVEVRAELSEELVARRVAVKANVTGAPANGFRVAGVRVWPSQITLRGSARTELEAIELSESINIAGVTKNLTRRVAVELPRGFSAVGSRRVTVEVRIEAEENAAPDASDTDTNTSSTAAATVTPIADASDRGNAVNQTPRRPVVRKNAPAAPPSPADASSRDMPESLPQLPPPAP